jgi:hypothetical protein
MVGAAAVGGHEMSDTRLRRDADTYEYDYELRDLPPEVRS